MGFKTIVLKPMLIEYHCDKCNTLMTLDEYSTNAHIKLSRGLGVRHKCNDSACNTVMYFSAIMPATVQVKPNQRFTKDMLKMFIATEPTPDELLTVELIDKPSPRE